MRFPATRSARRTAKAPRTLRSRCRRDKSAWGKVLRRRTRHPFSRGMPSNPESCRPRIVGLFAPRRSRRRQCIGTGTIASGRNARSSSDRHSHSNPATTRVRGASLGRFIRKIASRKRPVYGPSATAASNSRLRLAQRGHPGSVPSACWEERIAARRWEDTPGEPHNWSRQQSHSGASPGGASTPAPHTTQCGGKTRASRLSEAALTVCRRDSNQPGFSPIVAAVWSVSPRVEVGAGGFCRQSESGSAQATRVGAARSAARRNAILTARPWAARGRVKMAVSGRASSGSAGDVGASVSITHFLDGTCAAAARDGRLRHGLC